jgi:hypothetical protein
MKRELRQDESGSKADIVEYIQGQVSNLGILAYIYHHQIDDELFVGHLTEKAMGNFMYLFNVLTEIARGYYQDLTLNFIGSKEEVAEERVDLRKANKKSLEQNAG